MFQFNLSPEKGGAISAADQVALGLDAAQSARQLLTSCARYVPTELYRLPGMARSLDVSDILVKDEANRLGLGSFKALGGAYAVLRLALEHAARVLGRRVEAEEIFNPEIRETLRSLIFACATDGNHGRSVAAGARLVGAKAVVFVHAGVSHRRVEAIAQYGADIERVPGSYDDSVAEALKRCAAEGWALVSDTSWEGYEQIPRLVMQGYTVMVREVLEQLDAPVTHVFLQAGVGGFAAAVAAHMCLVLGKERPRFIIVEPDRAACVYHSALNRRLSRAPRKESTVMAMLECYEPSRVAWEILVRLADTFMTVTDSEAVDAMIRFAQPREGDPAILSGESGGAGLAGLLSALADRNVADELELSPRSRVLLFNTEGATDPDIYLSLTGLDSRLVGTVSGVQNQFTHIHG